MRDSDNCGVQLPVYDRCARTREIPAFVEADGGSGPNSAGRGALPHKRLVGRETENAIRGVKKNFQNRADWPVTSGLVKR